MRKYEETSSKKIFKEVSFERRWIKITEVVEEGITKGRWRRNSRGTGLK